MRRCKTLHRTPRARIDRAESGTRGMTLRHGWISALLVLLPGCAGPVAEVATIPNEEAAWQAMAPRLPGMPVAAVEQCAGPPRGAPPGRAGGTGRVYRAEDVNDCCRV